MEITSHLRTTAQAVCLGLAVLTASASAQDRAALSGPDQILMGAAGLAASVGTLALSSEGGDVFIVAAPLVSGAVVYGVGEALGHDGGLLETMGGAALGGLAGVTVMVVSVNQGDDLGEALAGVLVGLAVYTMLPPIAATAGYGYSLRPGLARAPGSDVVPALSLRLRL